MPHLRARTETTTWSASGYDGSPNGGYFWRWTAAVSFPVFPGESTVRFSTSEPRALLAEDFAYLQKSLSDDPVFLKMFCANAWRT